MEVNHPLEELVEIPSTGHRSSSPGSWLAGFPAILEDEKVGKAATDLYEDAQKMLKRIVDEKLLTAKAVVGFRPSPHPVGENV